VAAFEQRAHVEATPAETGLIAQLGVSSMIRLIVWAHRPHWTLLPR
jgi:hypothetical protein